MAGLDTTQFNSALKILYLGPLNDLTVRKHVLLNRLEKNKKDVSGSYAYIPLVTARNPAVASRKDAPSGGTVGAKLPDAGRQTYANATFIMGLHYGRGSVSGAVKRKSRNSAGAFAKAIDEEMQGLLRSLPDDLNRQVCGDGTGRAASISGNQTASDVIECEARDPFTMRVGDRIQVSDITAGPTTNVDPLLGTTVSDIAFFTDASGDAHANKHTVTLAATNTSSVSAADDAFYFGSIASGTFANEDTSWGQEIYGIQALIDDGNIGADMNSAVGEAKEFLGPPNSSTGSHTKVGGITRSSTPSWQATVLHNPAAAGTKRPITQTLLEQAWIQATMMNGGDASTIEGYCHPSIWGTIGMTQVGARVYNDFKETVEMGFSAIKLNGSFIFADRDLPLFQLFLLSMQDIFLLTQNDYEFLDDDGSVIRMAAGGGRDAWEFAINRDMQMGMRKARSHTRLTDLTANMVTMTKLH